MSGRESDAGRHFWRFNVVGLLGIVVQLAALELLSGALRIQYLVATALAVEIALIHNFVWHQRWTWVDRVAPSAGVVAVRFVKFNLANGVLSLLGNLVLMRLFVGHLRLPVLPSNLIAIALCWVANFLFSDRLVFRESRA